PVRRADAPPVDLHPRDVLLRHPEGARGAGQGRRGDAVAGVREGHRSARGPGRRHVGDHRVRVRDERVPARVLVRAARPERADGAGVHRNVPARRIREPDRPGDGRIRSRVDSADHLRARAAASDRRGPDSGSRQGMTDDAPETAERIRLLANRLYGERGDEVARDVRDLVARHRLPTDDPRARGRRVPSEGDAMLIAYADQVRAPGERPLATLEGFLEAHGDALTAVHLLPFFPYTSDDGFGVVDYLAVDERAG